MALSSCATQSDAMARELSSLRAELASLRVRTAQSAQSAAPTQYPSTQYAAGPYGGQYPVGQYPSAQLAPGQHLSGQASYGGQPGAYPSADGSMYGGAQDTQLAQAYPPIGAGRNVPPGPPGIPAAPDLNAPPPLPVVKLDPNRASPFAGGEPPIRIGTRGPQAPPVSAPAGQDTFAYGQLDGGGNLIDQYGSVVYKAGHDSPEIDTVVDAREDSTLYEDPHESPAQKVKRGTGVPKILAPGQKSAEPESPRPGVMALDDGSMLDGPTPGVHEVAQPRLRQFEIRDEGLPEDRDYAVRVDAYEQPRVAPPAAAAPSVDDAIYRTPAPDLAGGHNPVAAPAPVYPLTKSSYVPPESAPGSKQVQTQRSYKGSKERKVKGLYKEGMKRLNAGQQPKAVASFKKLLKTYPDHELADNALYWLGETAYSRGDWLQALTWFQDVILRYPEGNKLPDAMLKSALCYARLGDTSYAVQMLSEVEALFASAPVAEVARKRRLALADGGQ